MVNFPTSQPVGSINKPAIKSKTLQVAPSNAAATRQLKMTDRRRQQDRRGRRGAKQVMDRRSGPERRRSSISIKV